MKGLRLLAVLFLVATVLTGAKPNTNIVFFDGSYEEALKEAKKQKKPIFLDFYADWCMPCKQMEKYSFTDPDLAETINENFIPFKVNVDYFWGMDVAESFHIKTYPTIIFADKKGKEKSRAVGFKTAEELKVIADKVK